MAGANKQEAAALKREGRRNGSEAKEARNDDGKTGEETDEAITVGRIGSLAWSCRMMGLDLALEGSNNRP